MTAEDPWAAAIREITDGARTDAWLLRVMLAMLQDAMRVLMRTPHPIGSDLPQGGIWREALEWVRADVSAEAFSFVQVCGLLDLEPTYIRRKILERVLPPFPIVARARVTELPTARPLARIA